MVSDIYDPLNEYVNVFRPRFKEITEKTFAELAAEAKVDVKANHATCSKLYATETKLATVKSRMSRNRFFITLLWICFAALVAYIIIQFKVFSQDVLLALGGAALALLLILLLALHPRQKELRSEQADLSKKADGFRQEAWKQMEPLNRLYDWDLLTRMMVQAVPKLEFDPYFTTQRLADLKATYNWDDSFNEGRSVIYSHSGLINGNPFVICRTRKMVMGTKAYTGSITIHWTETEPDSDGGMRTVHRSETLTATVEAPYPEYPETTGLIYGNTAAPDLMFHRRKSGLAGRENSLAYRRTRRKLRKKARDLDGEDFAMMTNEEFEVLFDTRDRNDNQQYALLFTPLAQENMLKILRDKQYGYGDNFDFGKNKMINVIVPDHLQSLNLDMDPAHYKYFDYKQAESRFKEINAEYFRAIYFSFAPLLCVPMYQQIRPQSDIYGHDMMSRSSFWEHEALANFWGQEHFRHPDCVTDCILKTEETENGDGSSSITVYAHGYRAEDRVTYVTKFGGDGRLHDVPVYWQEYLPVTGTGAISMREDNDFTAVKPESQGERLERISGILEKTNLDLYRRHIASGLQSTAI